MNYKRELIAFMLSSGALKFGDFITKSGRRSPYFINTGAFDTGEKIRRLGAFYAACIIDNAERGRLPKDIKAIFGPAYKGIPLAVSASAALSSDFGLDVGYCFNRKEAKDHGEGGRLVGCDLKPGDKTIVVDDVITAGSAIREVMPLLRAMPGVDTAGLVIAVDRMERGRGALSATEEVRRDLGIEVLPIVNAREIIAESKDIAIGGEPALDEKCRRRMEEYMAKYCARDINPC
ncbi:MAG: orotate phosphoribosyltransferase [Clostridiales Family XIII bacterium]|jgi:orotate phosphoribosyltransferase|nr:orotate phosphoribosyltransferase [Clostridiales Family XIII bacterium]